MTRKEIEQVKEPAREKIDQMLKKILESDDDDFEFDCNEEVAFDWRDQDDGALEIVRIDMIGIWREAAIDILQNDGNCETMCWEGTVVLRDGKKCNDQAYGGESNTDGISESGPLYIDQEFLTNCELRD